MRRIINTLLLATVLFASCNQYQKSPSGMKYKIIRGSSKDKLKQGQYVKLTIEYRLMPKDSVLSVGHLPAYFMVDTSRASKYSFTEIVTECAPGDKAEFILNVDTLKKMGAIPEGNPMFHARDIIVGKVEILKTFPTEPDMRADYVKELDAEKQKEIAELKEVIKKKGAKVQTTRSGVFVEVENEGSGQKADSGWQASVLYKGSFINGKVFETNMDKNSPNNQPIFVKIGTGGVIPGWDEGLRLFGKGGKGRLYIPSMLAYGQQGSPPVIAPFTNLIFDIEVVDVTVPPPPAPVVAPGIQPKAKK